MITLDQPTIYDDTLYGEPLARPVRRQTLNTTRDLWTLGDWVIVLPVSVAHRAPDVQRMIAELRAWTRWSSRQLATVLGTSHTTVLNAEGGRPLIEARSGYLRRRLADVHDVIGRIFLLAARDPEATARILDTAPDGGLSPSLSLRTGNPERAYIAAIDVLRPRATGLLVGERPRHSGATAALHE